jgi:hypothetical protein
LQYQVELLATQLKATRQENFGFPFTQIWAVPEPYLPLGTYSPRHLPVHVVSDLVLFSFDVLQFRRPR